MLLTFGEIMLRLSPEGNDLLRQAIPGKLECSLAGAEASVASFVALQGYPAKYMTVLPDNEVTDAAIGYLRSTGLDTSSIIRGEGRFGVFFSETGASQRPSVVIYDRASSAIALHKPEDYDFEKALEGVKWIHISGITPALSENSYKASLKLLETAAKKKISVSCDLNFRKKLWRWDKSKKANELASVCMEKIVALTDLLIANEEDAADVFGIHAEGACFDQGKLNPAAYISVARKLKERFPNIKKVAVTLRESISSTHNMWGGMLYDCESAKANFAPCDENGNYSPYSINPIVDRFGAGDSFAGALIYSFLSGKFPADKDALRFAAAASCLKHSIKKDINFASFQQITALMNGSVSGRVQR